VKDPPAGLRPGLTPVRLQAVVLRGGAGGERSGREIVAGPWPSLKDLQDGAAIRTARGRIQRWTRRSASSSRKS
jgi:hypothetical protein